MDFAFEAPQLTQRIPKFLQEKTTFRALCVGCGLCIFFKKIQKIKE